MGANKIIPEATASIGHLLLEVIEESTEFKPTLLTDSPRPQVLEKVGLPALSVYLHNINPDEEGLQSNAGREFVDSVDGHEVYRDLPIYARIDYLISAWAERPEHEHELLGAVLQGLLDNRVLKGPRLKGDSFRGDEELPLMYSSKLPQEVLSRFWSSVQQPLKPAIQCWTVVPLYPSGITPIKRRVEERDIRFVDLNQLKKPPNT